MLKRLRPRLNFASVTAALALFIALGGAAWAVHRAPKNSVTTKSIRNGAITAKKLGKGAVTRPKLAASAPVAKAYAEVTPGGLVRSAFGMTSADVTHPTSPQAGVYCIKVDSKNAEVTPEFAAQPVEEAEALVLSDDAISDIGNSPADFGCPAGTHWIVETFALSDDARVAAFFTILLY
jgi:hypothetical protein